MADDRHQRLLAKLGALGPGGLTLEGICRGSVVVLDVSGAAVVLMSEEAPGALTASFGASVGEVGHLQSHLGEGPCLGAFRRGAPVLEPDLSGGGHERWPAFSAQAVGLGARAVFALPLQLGCIRAGVLYLYRDRPGVLSTAQLDDAFDLAGMAMLAALEPQGDVCSGQRAAGLGGDWAHRAAVHEATGVVAAQSGTKLGDALARIRAYAFAEDRSVYDVAAEIVSWQLRLG